MGILDSLTKNPGLLGLAALGIGLFIFRDRISGFFSDITGGAQGTAQIASLGGTLAKNLQSNLTLTPLPTDPLFGKQGFFTETIPTAAGATGDFFSGIIGGITDFFGGFLNPLPQAEAPLAPMAQILPIGPAIPLDLSIPAAPSIAENIIAPFQGGGISFEGGQIFETDPTVQGFQNPLSFITEQQGLTASQAANQLAIAQGFTPEEQAFLNQGTGGLGGTGFNPPAVSDPQFQGLTPEQIFLQLVGGNISNF